MLGRWGSDCEAGAFGMPGACIGIWVRVTAYDGASLERVVEFIA